MDRYESIRRALKMKAVTARLFTFGHGLVILAILAMALLGLGVGLSMVVPVTGLLFFTFSLASWLAVMGGLAFLAALAVRPLDAERAALRLERRYPDLKSELIAALQLGAKREYVTATLGFSPGMIDALSEKVSGSLPEVLRRPVEDKRHLGRDLGILLLLALTSVVAASMPGNQYGSVLPVMVNPLKARPFARPGIEVSPGNVRLLEGDPLAVTARVFGDLPGPLYLETRPARQPDGIESSRMEKKAPGTYARTVPRVSESLAYRVTHPKAASDWFTVEISPVPRVGNLVLELSPPAYTGLAQASQEGSGHIRCLKGTAVRWRAKANKPLAEASLSLSGGTAVPLSLSGETVEGEFVVTAGGRYRVTLRDREGFTPRQPDEYDINLIPDEFPVIDLLAPQEDLELDQNSLVDIRCSARDDFGLGAVSLVYRIEDGRTGRVAVADAAGRKIFQSGYSWDFGALGLKPGQQVSYHLEADDNDTISGPKTGVSLSRGIRVKDARAVHKDLAEVEKELVKEFTDILGDELELLDSMDEVRKSAQAPGEMFDTALKDTASAQQKITGKFDKSMEKMDSYLEETSRDSMADAASLYMKVLARQMLQKVLEGEKAEGQQLEELARMEDTPREDRAAEMGWMAKEKEKRIGNLEQALNLLQEAKRYQNMEEAVSRQEDLLERQRDLIDKLEKMTGLDRQGAQELQSMLQEIAQMLGDLMNQLTSMQSDLPEEFINAESLKQIPFNDLLKDLEEMVEALSRGDLKTAKQKAEDLLKKMNDMLGSLKEAAKRLKDLTQKGMQEFQDKQISELGRLVREQKELLEKTQGASAAIEGRLTQKRRREADELRRVMGTAAGEVERKLKDIQSEVYPPAEPLMLSPEALPLLNRKLNDLRRAAGQGNKSGMNEALKSLRDETARLAREMQVGGGDGSPRGRVAAGFKELGGILETVEREAMAVQISQAGEASPEEQRLLGEMAAAQKDLQGRSLDLSRKATLLSKAFPIIGPELGEGLEEAASFMADAEEKLSAFLPGEAVPPEREALYRLMKAQNDASQAAEQMMKMSGLQQGGAGSGEAGSLFGMMIGTSSSTSRGQQGQGRAGVNLRNFRIPGKQEYEVPRIFREEIMESMKAGYPRMFEKAIRQYYRSITE